MKDNKDIKIRDKDFAQDPLNEQINFENTKQNDPVSREIIKEEIV